MDIMNGSIRQESAECMREMLESAKIRKDAVIVVGGSTSEVIGKRIGTAGTPEVAREILDGLLSAMDRQTLCVQCCEHLNRAVVMPRALAERLNLEEVSVVPYPHAGGSLASTYYRMLEDPCVVEAVRADAGLDIGDVLIGMNIRPVAVPMRLNVKSIGEAHVVAAYSRPKLIGGERAKYRLGLDG